ncbi:MAG TPA: MafI family immunity protein [Gallionella sp.]|nr:MafI family immunity protein [Gallionella sp.]
MNANNLPYLEELSLHLFELLRPTFTESEISFIQEFVSAGEYGLALETIVAIVVEGDKKISDEALGLIFKLVDAMKFDKDKYENKLGKH